MNQPHSIGWDIGGAHVKAAVINQSDEIIFVFQQPCPLWQGLGQLHDAVLSIIRQLPDRPYRHAITMTGELVDLFENREEGVKQIIAAMVDLLPNNELLIFSGSQGLLRQDQIGIRHYQAIASANWLASASFAAQKVEKGLFIDIGSTTTDILVFDQGQVLAQGYTDYQRLQSKELIYTGIVRTPIMAVAQTVMDQDQETGIMAEYFATMADVYRVTGELNEAHDQTATADGAEKTILASARRLSRMIGCDFYPKELSRWLQFANTIRNQQMEKIQRTCERFIANHGITNHSPLIGAGVGRFLVTEIAQTLQYPYLDFAELCSGSTKQTDLCLADCAPAVALAYLANKYQ
ncbi:MAG: hydantoinase/oxoprolinase family protein [Methylovulum sp.]|nr:hydantoinase/oxoprolinase family protein [Methylovulum sp.]